LSPLISTTVMTISSPISSDSFTFRVRTNMRSHPWCGGCYSLGLVRRIPPR
jgi:hypothetical protein